MEINNFFEKEWLTNHWLRLIGLVDYCNHAVKQGEWYEEDVKQFYDLKDTVMEKLYSNPPPGATISLGKTLYLNLGNESRNMNVNLMQLNPSLKDSEAERKVLIVMDVTYAGRVFCFHIPIEKVKDWGLNISELKDKEWIPPHEFNHLSFKGVFEEIQVLLNLI